MAKNPIPDLANLNVNDDKQLSQISQSYETAPAQVTQRKNRKSTVASAGYDQQTIDNSNQKFFDSIFSLSLQPNVDQNGKLDYLLKKNKKQKNCLNHFIEIQNH